MKQILYILATLFLAAGCGPETSEQTEAVALSVDRTSLEFAAEGGEQKLDVTASEQIYVVPGETWLTYKKGATNGNVTEITLTAAENTRTQERTTRVSVVAGDEKIYVDVLQDAAEETQGGENGGNASTVVPENNGNVAWKVAEFIGLGWNLGNQFDAHNNGVSGETFWGNPKATQTTFNKVKAAGFKTVRIPVTWLGHIGEAPDYKIEEAWLDRIAEVVGYAEKAGLNVILNMHHDGADSKHWLNIISASRNEEVHQQIMQQIDAMWTQIAQKFIDKGDFLMFEAFNEIHDGDWGWGANRTDGGKQYACFNQWNQVFVDAVRETGGNNAERILGIPAYCTNIDIAIESFVMPEDKAEGRLMMSVHSYDPYDYALAAKKSEWGHTADASKKCSGDNEADMKKLFEKIYSNYVSKGVPVYLGEFGCVNRATEREQLFQQYYFKYFAKLAKTHGVPAVLWDNGAKGAGEEKHAFIDHGTGEYCSTGAQYAIQALIGSYNSILTLEDVYRNAPK